LGISSIASGQLRAARRWPTFNVADMAVSIGAFLLAWVLWGEERSPATVVAAAPVSDTRTEI